MSVGFYLHTNPPVVISDCLVTYKDSNQKQFSPSNIEFYNGENGELANLISKFQFLDEKTIICYSGTHKHIVDFSKQINLFWRQNPNPTRPMKFLQECDYEWLEKHPKDDYQILAASGTENEETKKSHINHYASKSENWQINTNHFRICMGIGSGKDEIEKRISVADNNLSRLGVKITDRPNLVNEIIGGLNGTIFFDPRYHQEELDWGGYFQANYYIADKQKWFRTPTWLHLFLVYQGQDCEFKGIYHKQILHASDQSDPYRSLIITRTNLPNGKPLQISWPVFPVLNFNPDSEDCISLENIDLKPTYVTLSHLFEVNSRQKINHNTYHFEDIPALRWNTQTASYEFNNLELGNWLREIILAGDYS